MIKKIKHVKNLGIFNDARWDGNLYDFRRFNLIYGWNGSGKTTFTRLFCMLNGDSQGDFSECTFKVEANDGDFTESDKYSREIRVFNKEYIDRNITLESGKTNPIFILGEENQELVKQIKVDEIALNGDSTNPDKVGLIQGLKQNRAEQKSCQKSKDKEFTDVAKLIGSSTTGVLSRNYRKPEAEKEFAKMQVKEILPVDEQARCELTLKQRQMPSDIATINIASILASIESHQIKAKDLLASTVESLVIERLRCEPEISEWVERGLSIHVKNALTHCEFCEQKIPDARIESLLSYFNDADKDLKEKIDQLLGELRKTYSEINSLSAIDQANLFDELRNDYSLEKENFEQIKEKLLKNITAYGKALSKKKMSTTIEMKQTEVIEIEAFTNCVSKLNKSIEAHRDKSKQFTEKRNEAALKIERHYLSEIWDEVKTLESKIKELEKAETILVDGSSGNGGILGVAALQRRIVENRNKISSSGPACDELNEKLSTFLGRSEIAFVLDEDGYVIQRGGKPVKNLSEGEKTAIAFVYFTIHMKDLDFDIAKGVVVIDDPISSLDSNSLFQAFSFLKNAVKEAHQVFILTHNFDFMRLILGWLNRHASSSSRYFMIDNSIVSDERVAHIGKLDSALKEFDSEYQYLFKLLDGFISDGTIASVYHIPNVSRKVLETFLMLMYPDSSGTYKKLERVPFDELKKTAIYKFTNDQSHMTGKGFDPSLVPECQNNVTYLLEMIEQVFPTHFNSLKQA